MKKIAAALAVATLAAVVAFALDGVEPVLSTHTGVTSITHTNGNTPMAVLAVRVVSSETITGAVNLVNSGYTMPLVESATNTVFAYTAGDAPLHMMVGGTITVSGVTTNSTNTLQIYRAPVRYSN